MKIRGLGLCQVRFGLGQVRVRLGLCQVCVRFVLGQVRLLLNNSVTLFITIKKVSTKIHQKCPLKFTKKMSTRIHLFCPRKFTFYVHEKSATHKTYKKKKMQPIAPKMYPRNCCCCCCNHWQEHTEELPHQQNQAKPSKQHQKLSIVRTNANIT